MYVCMYVCRYVCMYLSIYQSIYLCLYLSVFLSTYLSIYQFVYVSIYLSIYLSVCLSINLSICQSIYLLTYLSGYIYLHNGTVGWYDCGSFEMLFEDDWSEVLLQKTLLNQRERICWLNLNWWNNLNLILTLSNSWDALPSLVNNGMFIISYGYR